MSLLLDRLGLPSDARALIISCDDLGASHASTIGVFTALRDGVATCASLMVPAPWARHATAGLTAADDVGVHLTLNSEHPTYRWGPVTHAPSLLSGDGGFPASPDDLWEHADLDEVYRELRTQITRAGAWGLDVTHLAPHLTKMTLRPEFFDVYLDLADEFRLPIRLPSTVSEETVGFAFRRLAAERDIIHPDFFDHDWRPGSRERLAAAIESLPIGVTEVHIQPAIDTPEVRAMTTDAGGWIDDLQLALDPAIADMIANRDITLIGYRELRDAMRAGSAH